MSEKMVRTQVYDDKEWSFTDYMSFNLMQEYSF